MKKKSKKIWIFGLAAFALFIFLTAVPKEPQALMYHFVRSSDEAKTNPLAVSENTFSKHLHWLKAWGYKIYSADEFYQIKKNREQSAKGVLLTFDDGNVDFYNAVFPMLNEANAPAISFVVWESMVRGENGSMSLDQIRELSKSPLVTFGIHTASHKILMNLSAKELKAEIELPKIRFERALKQPFHYFCFPGGHFDEVSYNKVKASAYLAAFTTSRKRLQGRKEDLYSVVRVKITEKDSNPIRFWFKVSGLYSFLDQLKYGFKS